jgi:hypothetical protein
MLMTIRFRSPILSVMFLGLGASAVFLGQSLKRPVTTKLPPFSYLPSPDAARIVFPGQPTFGAAIVWVATVLHFADCVLEGADPRFMADLIEITMELDKRWSYPVEFAGVTVTDLKGKPNARTVKILEKGVSRFPDNWNLRIYLVSAIRDGSLGLTESVIADSCAKVLLPITSGKMESPDYARTLAFTLLQKSGRPDEAMRQLLAMYRSVNDPLLQVRFQAKMAGLLKGSLGAIGSDSVEFPMLAGAMLKSGDENQVGLANRVLVALAQDSANPQALGVARDLVGQYRAFQAKNTP